jgi:OOP family OmpA-OmpF porin
MKKILKGILPGLVLITLATPGFAENRQGAVTVSPYVGGYLLDEEQHEVNRPMFGLRTGYNFTENFGAEAMFGYSLTETKLHYGPRRETDLYRYGIDLLYHFMPQSNFVPFVVIGGGGTNFYTPNTPSEPSHYAGLFSYGGGVKYFVADNVALRGDVRGVLLVHDTGHQNLEYSAGLTFQFGGVRKTVACGLTPSADTTEMKMAAVIPAAADTTSPTVSFTAPVDGATAAPLNQKVNAAFSKAMDPATITAATFTLKQDKTPVSGNVTSAASTATFTPARNLEKGKVYIATLTTGAKDLAGNALERDYVWRFTAFSGPWVVKVLSTLENSHFNFNSAEITENGKDLLKHDVTILKADPNMKIRISGYTSAIGSEEYNQKLSERRAAAAKEYLVKTGGIDGNRITTIGYGEKNPAKYEAEPSDKNSAAAHANMRVLIEVIED